MSENQLKANLPVNWDQTRRPQCFVHIHPLALEIPQNPLKLNYFDLLNRTENKQILLK